MCGLVGFSGTQFNEERIKELLLANMSRGVDATGIYNNNTITKESIIAIDFLAKHDLVPESKFLGHCRAASYGNKTDVNNAHPFQYGDCILIHNGTLKQLFDIAKLVGWTHADFTVDSQILAKAVSINKHIEVFKELDGAVATIWTNQNNPNTIYCYRNAERPLYRGFIVGEGCYLSSIENSLKLIKCESIKEIKTNCIYTIQNGAIVSTNNITIPTKKTIYNNYYNNYYNNTTKSFLSTLRINDYVENISALANFTIGNLYRVTKTPFVSDCFISLENDLGEIVERRFSSFKPYEEQIEENSFVTIYKPQKDTSPLSQGSILWCKCIDDQSTPTMLHCVNLTDWNKTYLIPKHMCRLSNKTEIDAANTLLQKQINVAMSILNIKANIEELGTDKYIGAQSLIDMLSSIYKQIDDTYQKVSSEEDSNDINLVAELRLIKQNLIDLTKWIATEVITTSET